MSGALHPEDHAILLRALVAAKTMRSADAERFQRLTEYLAALRACDECGNWFEGPQSENECQRCDEQRRRFEALELRSLQ